MQHSLYPPWRARIRSAYAKCGVCVFGTASSLVFSGMAGVRCLHSVQARDETRDGRGRMVSHAKKSAECDSAFPSRADSLRRARV